MADADEDVIRHPTPAIPNESKASTTDAASDSDDEDTPLDLSFLAHLTSAPSHALPRRGEKDFEPHPTQAQRSLLERSREAVSEALSHTRIHAPKNHVRGYYDERTGLTLVPKPKGQLFGRIGRNVSGGGCELYPEEALWCLERGALDVVWSTATDGEGQYQAENEEAGPEGVPMSLQTAYAAYIGGQWGLTAEKYVVYAGLKRAGFTVFRAEGFHERKLVPKAPEVWADVSEQRKDEGASLWKKLDQLLLGQRQESAEQSRERLARGPLVRPGLYRSYNDIYRLLQIIPAHDPVRSLPSSSSSSSSQKTSNAEDEDEYDEIRTPFTTTYNIYQTAPQFRKTAPGSPAFRVCVVSARETHVPTMSELDGLLNEQPFAPPSGTEAHAKLNGSRGGSSRGGAGPMYGRLKYGYRNALLAVVDEGVTSYMRVADAGFSQERLYEHVAPARGGKGGGRGGRGGRGRGRGREGGRGA